MTTTSEIQPRPRCCNPGCQKNAHVSENIDSRSGGVVAIEMRRRAVLAELKRSYYEQAGRNLAAASPNGKRQVELFVP